MKKLVNSTNSCGLWLLNRLQRLFSADTRRLGRSLTVCWLKCEMRFLPPRHFLPLPAAALHALHTLHTLHAL